MAEAYFSVDVETAGPVPGAYSLLAVGACRVDDPACSFYVELQPTSEESDPGAQEVHRLSLPHLSTHGLPPGEAMERFAAWVEESTPAGGRPVLVAFNAAFDWMFIADYFHRFAVPNPFGHAALDIKALYMGITGEPWGRTGFSAVAARLGMEPRLPHHGLEDAVIQAEVFRRLLAGEIPGPTPADRKETTI